MTSNGFFMGQDNPNDMIDQIESAHNTLCALRGEDPLIQDPENPE